MKTILIGNGFNIQFSGRTYTSELILQRMKARARTDIYDELFDNSISGKEILDVLDGMVNEANKILNKEYDAFITDEDEKIAVDDFKNRYTYINKPEDIMMEDWFLVTYIHTKVYGDDKNTQDSVKVAFHRMFLDAIYNEGLIQELYKFMGKSTKRYLQEYDSIFTVNYDNNIEQLTKRKVYHLHGSFDELQPSENDTYVLGYLYKQKGECTLVKGFEHCYCNALLEYSGKKKIQQAELFHQMIVQFDYFSKVGSLPPLLNENEEFASLAFDHPELKVAPEYHFEDFKNIEDELVIVGLSPNNDDHILDCIKKNDKLKKIIFYYYSDKEIEIAKNIGDIRIQPKNVNELWRRLGVKQKQYNNNYKFSKDMDRFTKISNIFSDTGITEKCLKDCINELPRYEIDRLYNLVDKEIKDRGLENHTPKNMDDLLRDFGFISRLATKNGVLPPVLMLIYIAGGRF